MTPPRFQIVDRDGDPDSTGLALKGELDAHAAQGFADAVLARARPAEVLQLDVSGLEFIDSTGLRALVELEERLRRDGRRLVLDDPTDTVVRVLQIADLDEHFGVG